MATQTQSIKLAEKEVLMEVTFNAYEKKSLKGFATIALKDSEGKLEYLFSDLRVMDGKNGLFLSSPVKYGKKEDGTPDFEQEFPLYIIPATLKELAIKLIPVETKTTTATV